MLLLGTGFMISFVLKRRLLVTCCAWRSVVATNVFSLVSYVLKRQSLVTGWRRLIGSPKLQIIFHKRATKNRSLLQKTTYKDKGSYESSPPCTCCAWRFVVATSVGNLDSRIATIWILDVRYGISGTNVHEIPQLGTTCQRTCFLRCLFFPQLAKLWDFM